jgi:hypothetical protein
MAHGRNADNVKPRAAGRSLYTTSACWHARTMIVRPPRERVIAAALCMVVVWVCGLIGWNELVYALSHPDEGVVFLPVVLLMVALAWLTLSPRRKAGLPIGLLLTGPLVLLLVTGALALDAFGRAFAH